MDISALQENRTSIRNLLDKELENGKQLLQEDRDQGNIKVQLKNVINCIKRLNDLQQELENIGEKMSVVIEGQRGEEEIMNLIKDDWDYISTVMACRDELVNLQISDGEQVSPKENCSTIAVTDNWVDKMTQLTDKVHQILIGQQQLQHQQIDMAKTNTRIISAGFLEEGYGNTLTLVNSSESDQTTTIHGGNSSLGMRSVLEIGLSLAGGSKFGGDQSLGGGPWQENDLCLGRSPMLKGEISHRRGSRQGIFGDAQTEKQSSESDNYHTRPCGKLCPGEGPRLGQNLNFGGNAKLCVDQGLRGGLRLENDFGKRPALQRDLILGRSTMLRRGRSKKGLKIRKSSKRIKTSKAMTSSKSRKRHRAMKIFKSYNMADGRWKANHRKRLKNKRISKNRKRSMLGKA